MQRKIILYFFIFIIYMPVVSMGQAGAGPVTSCSFPPGIPEICGGASYPASTSGTASALGASFSCPGTSPITGQPAFFFFEVGTAGNINLYMEPVDPVTGALLTNDLDFIAWGPFANINNMCTQLQAINRVDCSYSPASVETCVITGANVGEFYVVLVSNWDAANTPAPCNIAFSADTTFGAVGNPFAGGGFAGDNNTINPCSSEPPFDLLNGLNNQPDNNGYWVNESNDTVNNIFDPLVDTSGIYTYIIPGSTNCPGDTALLTVNILNSNFITITTPNSVCIGDMPIALSANPIGGNFSGAGVIGNSLNTSTTGNIQIEYIYQSGGCSDTAIQTITINESPTVLNSDIITTNPLCFGESTGIASIIASGGQPPYSYNWFGANPLALPSGTFTYTVTDSQSCTYSSDITLYDPQNNLAVLTPYNSSCFGENDGSIGITFNSCAIPPGNVSTLSYCNSSPNNTLSAQPSAIIEEVILIGDNNDINNNTSGTADLYEDYTSLMYADIEVGQSYSVNIILNGIGTFGNTVNNSGAKVFIDYNIDGDFGDPGEEIGIIAYRDNSNIGLSETINFTVPTTYGAFGPTRMRVVSQYRIDQDPNLIGPCDYALPGSFDQPWYGATEDYTIVLNCPNSSATYTWDDGQTVDSITNLSPGTYVVTITPTSGCAVQDSAVISEPEEIEFNAIISNVSCNTYTDGQIIIDNTTITGGNGGPYNVDWGLNNPLSLGSGTYDVTVSDISTITTTNLIACKNDTSIVINEPEYFSVDFSVSLDEICLNDSIFLEFNFNQGGIEPFTVDYTENSISQSTLTYNSAGTNSTIITPNTGSNTYIITNITDDNGCSSQNIIASQNTYVNPLPNLNVSIAPSQICIGQSATLIFSSSSGSAPFNLDYFENGVLNSVSVPSSGLSNIVSPDDTTKYLLYYTIDDNGCESYLNDEVSLDVNEIPEIVTSYENEFCEGENIEINVSFTSGVPPFNIDYTFNGTPTSTIVSNFQETLSFVSTNPTNIEITSITSNICSNIINETITINTNPLPISSISGTYDLCDDPINPSSVDINISTNSGTPLYNIYYTNGFEIDSIINTTSNSFFTTSEQGIYTLVKVIDSKGCESINLNGFASVIINPLPEASITAYPIQTEISNPMIYFTDESENHISGLWDFDNGETQATNFKTINHLYADTGTYRVSLTTVSNEGCENTVYQTIVISPIFKIYIPNAFTPNNDLYNDYFMPIVDGIQNYEISIFNRVGQMFFSSDSYSNEYCGDGCDAAWDGKKSNGEYANTGVYVYKIIITDLNGKVENIEGSFKLIR